MPETLFGIFRANLDVFGLVVGGLLCVVAVLMVFIGRHVAHRVKELDELHDDIVAVKMQDEGRKSFVETITRHDYEIKTLNRRHGELFDRVNHIDDRCERRLEQTAYTGEDRRKK